MSFLNEQATYLSGLGLVNHTNTRNRTIFLGSAVDLPDTDGPFVHMRLTGGWSPILLHNSDTIPAYQRPSAHVVILGANPDVTYAKAEQIWNAYVQKRTLTISGIYYVSMDVGGDISDVLGKDDLGRIRYSFNINAVKRPS